LTKEETCTSKSDARGEYLKKSIARRRHTKAFPSSIDEDAKYPLKLIGNEKFRV